LISRSFDAHGNQMALAAMMPQCWHAGIANRIGRAAHAGWPILFGRHSVTK